VEAKEGTTPVSTASVEPLKEAASPPVSTASVEPLREAASPPVSTASVEPLVDAPKKKERVRTVMDHFVVALLGRDVANNAPSWMTIVKIWSSMLLLGLLVGTGQRLIGAGANWFWEHRQEVAASRWFPLAAVGFVLGAGWILHRLKRHMRLHYACLEIVCAIWIVLITARRFALHAADANDAVVGLLAFASAAYVIVRGLDNYKGALDELEGAVLLGAVPATQDPRKRRLLSAPIRSILFVIGWALPWWL
jgi:hypothetical protein